MKILFLTLLAFVVFGCSHDSKKKDDPIPSKTPTILTGTEWKDNARKWIRSFTEDTLYAYDSSNSNMYVIYYTINQDSLLFIKQIYTISRYGVHSPTPDYPGEHYKAFISNKLYIGTEDPGIPGVYSLTFWGDKTK